MKKTYISLMMALLLSSGYVISQANCPGNWLSVDGNQLLDADGNAVLLAGVNWSGFEANISVLEGLYARDMKSMLLQAKDLGFNSFRIPWHNMMLRDGATYQEANYWVKDPYTYNGVPEQGPFSNLYLEGKTKPIEVLDELVIWCQENDMKIILDCHSRNPGGYLVEGLWYTDSVSEDEWIADWVFIADRYKNYDAVIGMDLNNEPHGRINDPEGARWGNDDPATDWRLAAEKCGNAILAVNPNVLIIVEGIEAYTKPDGTETTYWWGGNLQGARDFPIRLSNPSKLFYSPHEYGPTVYEQPWFDVPEFPDNLPAIWEEQFNFLNTNDTSPLFIGELGIRDRDGKDEQWFRKFVDYIKENKLHFAFWTLNPNSGDTGGILQSDWSSIEDWKMEYLQPILSNPIPNCFAGDILSVNDVTDIAFRAYPNPATQVLNFNFKQGTIIAIDIYDLNGREVTHIDDKALADDTYTHDVSGLAAGMYLSKITVADTKETFTKKIIIQ